jgi:Acetyltransferase (GNAT) domain
MKPTYRWIDGPFATPEDRERIDMIVAARGWMSFNWDMTRVRVVEDEAGKLLGFYALQMVPHAEPIFLAPATRGTGLADELADDMLEFLTDVHARGWMIVADSPHVGHMCEERGMKKLGSPVYVMVPKEQP